MHNSDVQMEFKIFLAVNKQINIYKKIVKSRGRKLKLMMIMVFN